MYKNMAPLMPHRWLRVLLIGLVAGVLLGQPLIARAAAPSLAPSDTVFTVNSTNDANDGSCTDAHCSLREAILAANATANGSAPDEIHFNIPGGGVRTITPHSSGEGQLPPVTDPVVIDGTTQPGASCAAWPPTLLVQVSGSSLGTNSRLLTISTSNSTVRGLVLNGTTSGAALKMLGSSNRIECNYIGTNAAGTAPLPNNLGVSIDGESNNIVGTNGDGTADDAERNLISGNTIGVSISFGSANRVAGNFIGTNAAGTGAVANTWGVNVYGGVSNIIGTNGDGTADTAERNVISGNIDGITLYGGYAGSVSHDNWIAGNYIGTNATGTDTLPNSDGLRFLSFAQNNLLGTNSDGTADEAERNLISGNSSNGVLITGAHSINNRVAGNFIGTNAAGTSALPNLTGVLIRSGAGNNIIGTNGDGMGDAAERNLISGHNASFEGTAVRITGAGTTNNRVAGNTIGTTADGTTALANSWGVRIDQSENNVIGTNGDGAGDAAEGNLISGSVIIGIYLENSSNNNRIAGNTIGTDATGTSAIPNRIGIEVYSGENTLIGTDGDGVSDEAERNLISGNTEDGIRILTTNNRIAGNYIGTNAAGTSALANDRGITLGGLDNILGTNSDGSGDEAERNLISGNTSTGVVVGDRHWVAGNYIGTNAAGTAAIPNGTGIFFSESSGPTIVGTNGDGTRDAAEGNLISGNIGGGVVLSESRNNRVAGNRIGTDVTGTSAIPNNNGVVIGMSYDNIVGTNGDGTSDELERNLISGNTSNGVLITGADSTNNRVAGNTIGTTADGTSALPNLTGVLIQSDAGSNIIGTNGDGAGDAAERNLISGHNATFEGTAVRITGAGNNNRVAGNYIGTNADGTTALANSWGVRIDGSENTIIGTNGDGAGDAAEGNLISGNAVSGLSLENSSNNNRIAGNTIGTDATGTSAVANAMGIYLLSGDYNIIGTNGDGTSDAAEGNLISGNIGDGAQVLTSNNRVAGNTIGTDAAGTSALPNRDGVVLSGLNNILGTNSDGSGDAAERNLISGNGGYGVVVRGENWIAGNTIGTNAAGTAAIPNRTGIQVIDTGGTNIIGTNGDGTRDAAEGNLISGNSDAGVLISEAYNTRVAGNHIGTDATGTSAIPNTDGVLMGMSRSNVVGTNGDGTSDELERNLISGNSRYGIRLSVESNNNTIAGNLIGVTPSVDTPGDLDPLGNGDTGIIILDVGTDSTNNLIGGNLPVEQNTIAYNRGDGVALMDGTSNRVQRNAIHDNSELGIDLGDDGPTPNDAEDPDLGPNHFQNYPTVTAVINGSGELVVTYFVDSLTTNSTYPLTIEFFEADDAASGEGQTFLAEDSYNETPATPKVVSLGNANALGVAAGDPLVATATDADGNTSEFSSATVVESDVPTALTLDTFAAGRGTRRGTPALAALGLAALVGFTIRRRRRAA